MTRRPLAALATAALALTLTACGSSDEETPAAGGSSSSDGAFPVTIEHTFGETTIEAEPERVVTIGFNEQDFALALGVTPVGVREYLSYDANTRPWAVDLLPDEPLPTVGAEELDLEAIAALQPDLILGVYSFIDESTYDLLSQIAPTVAESADYELGATPWQEQTRMDGAALGKADEADALVADVEGAFADAREANPSFEGQTLALDYWFEGTHGALPDTDLRMQFFTELGFQAPATTGSLSAESLGALDGDVLVAAGTDQATLLAEPLFAALPVVAEDRTVFVGGFDKQFPAALGFTSPLSLPYALELIVPPLAAAADADPATPVEQIAI
ncbi:iron-siderophore ABC transporter substrate-binding protein [Klenkia terrae]|uniref:Iron-siderophore ABC transporter substrate-binding protein n=1 Tax=Klenkia terrae TaxID=1052259 RepID=A0ABU8E0H4_9ACTN